MCLISQWTNLKLNSNGKQNYNYHLKLIIKTSIEKQLLNEIGKRVTRIQIPSDK